MELRPYQKSIAEKVIFAVQSGKNPLVQADTGAGKTPVEAYLANHFDNVIVIAHRNVLIGQLSEKMAAFSIFHDTISTEHTRRSCQSRHRKTCGSDFILRGSNSKFVASIQSLDARHARGVLGVDANLPWVIIIDEAHHVMPDNIWGIVKRIFPNCTIVGFTATPIRGDGGSLSIKSGGIFDCLIQADGLDDGRSVATLMSNGYLADYVAYYPLDIDSRIRRSSETKSDELVVSMCPLAAYKKYAEGKKTILMMPSIWAAKRYADLFKANNIPAACINSTMSCGDVSRIIDAFISGDVLALFNVEMVNEGFDVPTVECVILARPIGSFGLYRQCVGRVLRPSKGKSHGVLVDLCGNVVDHGLPDDVVVWDLDNPPRKPRGRRYNNCTCGRIYLITLPHCPDCGNENPFFWERPNSIAPANTILIDLDTEMVRTARKKMADEIEKITKKTLSELKPTPRDFGSSLLCRAATAIEKQFILNLIDLGVCYAEINKFLHSHIEVAWYAKKGFVVGKVTKEKSLKEFTAWQLQQ